MIDLKGEHLTESLTVFHQRRMTERANILLVEDSETDARLVELAVRDTQWISSLDTAVDGEKALEYLEKSQEGRGLPHLILLDLNMPRMNGFELLQRLKREDSPFRRIPVIVLTTSSATEDVRKAYDLHANSYICKPGDFRTFEKWLATLEDFWFQVTRLVD